MATFSCDIWQELQMEERGGMGGGGYYVVPGITPPRPRPELQYALRKIYKKKSAHPSFFLPAHLLKKYK